MAARRLHGLIYATIALCCVVVALLAASLGTNQWFKSQGVSNSSALKVDVSYGLFKGEKTKSGTGNKIYKLQIVCKTNGAKCMFSCGTTGAKRKDDLQQIIDGKIPSETNLCGDGEQSRARVFGPADVGETRQSPGTTHDLVFLNFGLYVMTIICLALAMIFAVLAGGLALYNTYRTPIQPILSVFGLYIWNGISAAFIALAMVMYGVAFATSLKKNAAISDTLIGLYSSDGEGQLGVSYWLLLPGIIFPLANIAILKYRSWKIIQIEATNVKVMTENLETGDILLF